MEIRIEGRIGRPRHPPRAFPLGALLVPLLLLSACSRQGAPPEPGAVVAEVGEERITLEDVRREVALRRGLPAVLATGGAGRSEVEDALRRLAEEAIVVAEGKRRGLSVTEKELEEEVTRHRGDFPPGGLEKALAQAGLDLASWREGIRRSLLHRKAADAVAGSLPARPPDGAEGREDPPAELLPPGEARVRVMELIFSTKGEASSARELLAAGRSPEGAASLAAGTVRPTSVDLGWFAVSALPPGMPGELARLPRGGVTGVVSFGGGHAVFRVEERRESGEPLPAAPPARALSARAGREEAYRLWLEEARGKTKVRIDEELLSTLYPGRP